MSLQCEAPPVDDSWRDEPLCSVDALPDPEFSYLAAVASTPDVSPESVTDPPTTTPATTPPACGCIPCTLHRNLLKAWLQAREFDSQATT